MRTTSTKQERNWVVDWQKVPINTIRVHQRQMRFDCLQKLLDRICDCWKSVEHCLVQITPRIQSTDFLLSSLEYRNRSHYGDEFIDSFSLLYIGSASSPSSHNPTLYRGRLFYQLSYFYSVMSAIHSWYSKQDKYQPMDSLLDICGVHNGIIRWCVFLPHFPTVPADSMLLRSLFRPIQYNECTLFQPCWVLPACWAITRGKLQEEKVISRLMKIILDLCTISSWNPCVFICFQQTIISVWHRWQSISSDGMVIK